MILTSYSNVPGLICWTKGFYGSCSESEEQEAKRNCGPRQTMTADITGSIFLILAVISFAASLTFLLGLGGKRTFRSLLVGAGFALLAGSFIWLWLG